MLSPESNRGLVLPRSLLVSLFMFATLSILSGQDRPARKDAPSPHDRIFVGGNFGLQFGTFTYIEISPVIGYWLAPRLSVAAGPTFKYYKDPYGDSDVWGGKGYARFIVVNDLNNLIPIGMGTSIFLHGEYESLSFKSEYLGVQSVAARINVNTALVGGGFSQPVGGRGRINFAILWVVYDSGYQIYNNPVYRLEFTFGL